MNLGVASRRRRRVSTILEAMPLSEDGVQGGVAAEAAGAVDTAAGRVPRFSTFKGLRSPPALWSASIRYFTHHMKDIWPEPEQFDPDALSPRKPSANRHRFALGAVQRRRAICASGCTSPTCRPKNLRPAFPAKSRSLTGARLPAGLADVADPQNRATDCGWC